MDEGTLFRVQFSQLENDQVEEAITFISKIQWLSSGRRKKKTQVPLRREEKHYCDISHES